MNKIERFHEDEWVAHVYPRNFIRETTSGPARLRIGLPERALEEILRLLQLLDEPLTLLYVLHTAREGRAGRYQSPELTRQEATDVLKRFASYFTSDGRHDLWFHSSSGLLVWDRHNVSYFYGELAAAEKLLRTAGYAEGAVAIPSPHAHNYHEVFDPDETSLLAAFDWVRSDLRPEDAQ